MNSWTKFILFLSVNLIINWSCSNPAKEYEKLEKFQSVKEQLLQQNFDINVKLQTCSEVIDSLNAFSLRCKNIEWRSKASVAANLWNKRMIEIERLRDYDFVINIQKTSEQTQNYTNDYEIKIQSCGDVISSIRDYLDKYGQDSQSRPVMETALMSWNTRKEALEQEIKSLYNKAHEQNRKQAIYAARIRHSLSSIESIVLDSSKKQKDGNKIYLFDNYKVRMVGLIIGTNIFKLDIRTVSVISMDTKSVESYGEPEITE